MNNFTQLNLYLEYFIWTCQGDPKESIQTIHNLFRSINTVLQTNEATYSLYKEPISTNKLCQGDAAWSTKKTVLGWELDTKENQLRLTNKLESKVRTALDTIPVPAHQVYLRKYWQLLGLLQSITPYVAGEPGMFTRLQNTLR